MAFVNEYIPEGDYPKYDLRRVCGEKNLPSRRDHMHSRTWTVDRERDIFLIKVWAHHESEFSGWAFYWKGEWLFFEMRPVEGRGDREKSECWFQFHVKGLVVPDALKAQQEELIDDMRAAITGLPGGVDFSYEKRNVIIEFIGE